MCVWSWWSNFASNSTLSRANSIARLVIACAVSSLTQVCKISPDDARSGEKKQWSGSIFTRSTSPGKSCSSFTACTTHQPLSVWHTTPAWLYAPPLPSCIIIRLLDMLNPLRKTMSPFRRLSRGSVGVSRLLCEQASSSATDSVQQIVLITPMAGGAGCAETSQVVAYSGGFILFKILDIVK